MPASYFPLDVNFFDHPKVVPLSDAAVRLHLSAIGYANRLMTDGFIAGPIPRRLGGVEGHVDELVRAVLWHSAGEPCPRGHDEDCPKLEGGGWRIHDFLDHNRSRETRVAAQESERDRKAAWRKRQRDAAVPRDTSVPGDAGRGRTGDVRETGNTETETETETSKVNTVVAQARPIDDITAVFTAWQDATGKHRAKLDPKRRRRIREALKHYPLTDVLDAVQGWQYSPFHCGQNDTGTKHNDLDLLLRDAKHLEEFRDLWRDGPPTVMGPQTAKAAATYRQMQAMGEEVNRAARGDDLGRMDGDRRQAQRQLSPPTA